MKIEPGDKVLFTISPKHVASGIVQQVDGEYVIVIRRKQGRTFPIELLRGEVIHVTSHGNPIPETDHQARKRIERKAIRRKLAMVLAEVYHGRPVTMGFIMGEATGGDVFLRQADAVMEVIQP